MTYQILRTAILDNQKFLDEPGDLDVFFLDWAGVESMRKPHWSQLNYPLVNIQKAIENGHL